MKYEPQVIADNVRGIYAIQHAARTMREACDKHGWNTSDPDNLKYAAENTVEEATEVAAELEGATFTDPEGRPWRIEQAEGGDVLLIPA